MNRNDENVSKNLVRVNIPNLQITHVPTTHAGSCSFFSPLFFNNLHHLLIRFLFVFYSIYFIIVVHPSISRIANLSIRTIIFVAFAGLVSRKVDVFGNFRGDFCFTSKCVVSQNVHVSDKLDSDVNLESITSFVKGKLLVDFRCNTCEGINGWFRDDYYKIVDSNYNYLMKSSLVTLIQFYMTNS